jgi:hypothetical protein
MFTCEFCDSENEDVINCDECNVCHCFENGSVSCLSCPTCHNKCNHLEQINGKDMCRKCVEMETKWNL